MTRVRLRSLAVTAVLALVIMGIAGVAFAADPTVTVTSSGGALNVSGSGFTPSGEVEVEVTVEAPAGVFTTFSITLTANSDGTLSFEGWRPAGFPTGEFTVVVTGHDLTTDYTTAPTTATVEVYTPEDPCANASLNGDGGDNTLTGGPCGETINGNGGSDVIEGRGGDDDLWGDGEAMQADDTFVYDLSAGSYLGNDTIWDFDALAGGFCEPTTGDFLDINGEVEISDIEAGLLFTFFDDLGSVLLSGIHDLADVRGWDG